MKTEKRKLQQRQGQIFSLSALKMDEEILQAERTQDSLADFKANLLLSCFVLILMSMTLIFNLFQTSFLSLNPLKTSEN